MKKAKISKIFIFLILSLLIFPSCNNKENHISNDEILKQLKSFMLSYSKDLNNKDWQSIIRRYDANGAYIVLNGKEQFLSKDTIFSIYKNKWKGPEYFKWIDLKYDILSPKSYMVIGKFLWKIPEMPDTSLFSYTSVLVKREAGIKLRLENELMLPKKK